MREADDITLTHEACHVANFGILFLNLSYGLGVNPWESGGEVADDIST